MGLALWLLSLAGRVLDVLTLALALHLGLFSLPAAYKAFKAPVDKAIADGYHKAQVRAGRRGDSRVSRVPVRAACGVCGGLVAWPQEAYDKLDRRVRAAAVLAPLALLLVLLRPLGETTRAAPASARHRSAPSTSHRAGPPASHVRMRSGPARPRPLRLPPQTAPWRPSSCWPTPVCGPAPTR